MAACSEKPKESNIHMLRGQGGTCRVFIVQTRNGKEQSQAQALFGELEEFCSVRALSEGVTTAYAVQARDAEALLTDLALFLKGEFRFSVVYDGFNPLIERIVEDLAVETGSRLRPVPKCRSCGCLDPFPVRVSWQEPGRKARSRASLCARCVASAEAEGIDGIRRLVMASGQACRTIPNAALARRSSILHFGRRRKPAPAPEGRHEEPEAEPEARLLAG